MNNIIIILIDFNLMDEQRELLKSLFGTVEVDVYIFIFNRILEILLFVDIIFVVFVQFYYLKVQKLMLVIVKKYMMIN